MTTAKIKDKQASPRAAHVLVNVARAQQHIAKTLGDEAEARAKALLKAISIGLKDPLQDDLKATHLRQHRRGRPAKLATDTELAAFITARFATHTFPALAAAVRTHFPKSRRVIQSSIYRFWLKTKSQPPPQ